MIEEKFIKQNAETWKKLEFTLNRLKSNSINKFEGQELDDFINAYNLTCGHLSYCRTYFGDSNTTSYLNNIVAAAHGYIYTSEASSFRKFRNFLLIEFPLLVKSNMNFFLISTSLFLLGSILSFILTLISVDNAVAFLSKDLVDGVMSSDLSGPSQIDSAVESSFILTNNIRVGFIAFVSGVSLGIGTSWVLLTNGYMLGSLAALYFHKGGNLLFWSLILPHGVIELFAIFVCGAAGLIIGQSLINPGVYSRKDSFILRGKSALKLVLGTIPLFIIAGIIEGYLTPSSKLSEVAKLIFALFTLILVIVYITIPNLKYKLKNTKE